MEVAVIGISGPVGSRMAAELLTRGHQVTGIERNPAKSGGFPGVTLRQGDATQPSMLAPLIRGNDAAMSAARFQTSNADALIATMKQAGVKRLLIVGGAGSLEVAPGKAFMDTPYFPEVYQAEARAGGRYLATLRNEKDIDWTFLSPSAEFEPGSRTGEFRLVGNRLLVDIAASMITMT